MRPIPLPLRRTPLLISWMPLSNGLLFKVETCKADHHLCKGAPMFIYIRLTLAHFKTPFLSKMNMQTSLYGINR